MAEVFEEIEVEDIIVTGLLSTDCDTSNMTTGDLIVVDSSHLSSRFPRGTDGQFLITDTTDGTYNLRWADASSALGVLANATGDILYSPDGQTFTVLSIGSSNNILTVGPDGVPIWGTVSGSIGFDGPGQVLITGTDSQATILNPGTTGTVLTIGPSGIPIWSTPAAAKNIALLHLVDRARTSCNVTSRNIAYFTWDETQYGAAAKGLSNGKLIFYGDIPNDGTATVELVYSKGDVPTADMVSATTIVSGCNELSVTIPDSSSCTLFSLNLAKTGGTTLQNPEIYGVQLQFDLTAA